MTLMWPFTRRRREPSATPEAEAALQRAVSARDAINGELGLVERLRIQRVENHIGPAVADAIRRRRD